MFTRREIVTALSALPVLGLTSAGRIRAAEIAAELPHRLLGRTGHWVVPLGLGGQASLQWTSAGIDPADIIVRAVELGVNYLDSANAYGPSQLNYGEAFRRLHLVPTDPDYNPALRERLYVATKTGRRFALDRGSSAATAVDELKRSLTQVFGDGRGAIPEGAYLDSIQIHNLTNVQQVDQIYLGLDRRGEPGQDRIGALAGLLDFRDGTNHTRLNPEQRQYVRHIGITGHQSSPVLMNALQRDEEDVIDTLLVALNANDRQFSSHQHNVLPVAEARGLGVIAMKAFADGVFYGKPARFSNNPNDVVLTVGRPGAVDSADLVRYPVSIPGVTCVITGIGKIDREDPGADQLVANLTAATADVASPGERRRIEEVLAQLHGVETNYFQDRPRGLVQPGDVGVERDGDRVVIAWTTALAGAEPIRSYRIYAGERLLLALPFQPQTTLAPLAVSVPAVEITAEPVWVEASESPPEDP